MTTDNSSDTLDLHDATGSFQAGPPAAARTEAYLAERNALVSECRLRGKDLRTDIGYDARTSEEQAAWDCYGEAIDALKAFDAAHGGTPIL